MIYLISAIRGESNYYVLKASTDFQKAEKFRKELEKEALYINKLNDLGLDGHYNKLDSNCNSSQNERTVYEVIEVREV